MITPTKKTQNWLPGILNDFLANEWIAKVNANAPAINIIESDKEYRVEIAAPGVAKENLKIRVDDQNQLIVTIEKKEEKQEEQKNEKYLRREFMLSQFQQTMILPDNVNKDMIDATQENGVLMIRIPKSECEQDEKSKNIEVK